MAQEHDSFVASLSNICSIQSARPNDAHLLSPYFDVNASQRICAGRFSFVDFQFAITSKFYDLFGWRGRYRRRDPQECTGQTAYLMCE